MVRTDAAMTVPRLSFRAMTRPENIPPTARSSGARVPPCWRGEVARILISRTQLRRRIQALAREIERDYAEADLVIVALLNGTVLFLADLIRHLDLPLHLDFIGVSSYGRGTESRKLIFTKELRLDVRGRDILLVDDILDTGRTLQRVRNRLQKLGPRRIRICVLLDKPERRQEELRADYVGFRIPNLFVVGYGLDFAERYRNLPFIGELRPEIGHAQAGPPLEGARPSRQKRGRPARKK